MRILILDLEIPRILLTNMMHLKFSTQPFTTPGLVILVHFVQMDQMTFNTINFVYLITSIH